jgi:hypothetical protein
MLNSEQITEGVGSTAAKSKLGCSAACRLVLSAHGVVVEPVKCSSTPSLLLAKRYA